MRLGIDLGGSKIEIAALDDAGGFLLRRRVATPQGNYGATLNCIRNLVLACEADLEQRGSLGIGIPGAESGPEWRIKNANSTCLIGQTLRSDLEILLDRDIRLANDANCFALSEAVDGAGSGASVVFGVILGTGVGGGIVVNGQPLQGINAIAGEWGHNPLPLPTTDDLPLPDCYCGRQGCIETYLSGPGLAADHNRRNGQQRTAPEIVRAAENGDVHCEASLRRYESRLGRALAGVINLLDPEVIVLGGGMSQVQRLYRNLPDCCAPHVFSDRVLTRFLPPRHGDSSGVRGAAWLWN